MYKIFSDTYNTYIGNEERHRVRIILFLFVSSFISIFGNNLDESTLPVMTLAISVLTGFSFTALFSNYTMTSQGLPDPINENDRNYIRILENLGKNFRVRSEYFISISVFNILMILILTIDISDNYNLIRDIIFDIKFGEYFIGIISISFSILEYLLLFFVFFTFFECMYTFYRLTETIMAVLDTRGSYIAARKDS